MSSNHEIKVPDIGGATNVDVIEILVSVGDKISKDQSIVTLETDKASMEIPSPVEGVVSQIITHVGSKVSEGDVLLTVTPLSTHEEPTAAVELPKDAELSPATPMNIRPVMVPDIGGVTDVDVIEIHVKSGDKVEKDMALITLEGDKATMEIPSPFSGVVSDIAVHVGDKVSQGTLILNLLSEDSAELIVAPKEAPAPKSETDIHKLKPSISDVSSKIEDAPATKSSLIFAGPSVRRMGREFGIPLEKIKGTGRKGRIIKEDLQNFVKTKLQEKPAVSGLAFPEMPSIDFSKFGTIEVKPLNKIKKLTGINVHRSWVTIPQVTQFDEADITELESFRKMESENAAKQGYKLTLLAFVCKALTKAMIAFPQFNASLDSTGENLILKQYYNIGIAVDTPNGLVVPVIAGVDQLSVGDVAREMARLSSKARDKGLMPTEMSGGSMTISSLGGIGGTAFTPIVNAPEVAILGLSKGIVKPLYDGQNFVPRLMLPLSLSYDHRVIDGAEAARFTRYLAELLSDIRRVLL